MIGLTYVALLGTDLMYPFFFMYAMALRQGPYQ